MYAKFFLIQVIHFKILLRTLPLPIPVAQTRGQNKWFIIVCWMPGFGVGSDFVRVNMQHLCVISTDELVELVLDLHVVLFHAEYSCIVL